MQAHLEGLRELARSLSWTFATHRCEQPPEPALLALYTDLYTKAQG
jgi:hypothetical protein